jgi:hypothetical protein
MATGFLTRDKRSLPGIDLYSMEYRVLFNGSMTTISPQSNIVIVGRFFFFFVVKYKRWLDSFEQKMQSNHSIRRGPYLLLYFGSRRYKRWHPRKKKQFMIIQWIPVRIHRTRKRTFQVRVLVIHSNPPFSLLLCCYGIIVSIVWFQAWRGWWWYFCFERYRSSDDKNEFRSLFYCKYWYDCFVFFLMIKKKLLSTWKDAFRNDPYFIATIMLVAGNEIGRILNVYFICCLDGYTNVNVTNQLYSFFSLSMVLSSYYNIS